MKAILIGIAVLVGLIGGGFLFLLSNASLRESVTQKVLVSRTETAALLSDKLGANALDIVMCGSGSPLAPPTVGQTCVAVFAGDNFYIIDIGNRSVAQATQMLLPLERLKGVLLTHFHSDHIADLGQLHLASWVRGRKGVLPVYGGQGVNQVVNGFNLAYKQDYKYRSDHHADLLLLQDAGLTAVEIAFSAADDSLQTVIESSNGLKISAFQVQHAPIEPAFGYLIEYKGRKVVVSGDTIASENVAKYALKADLLFHEVLSPKLVTLFGQTILEEGNKVGGILLDTLDYHTSPAQAVEIANNASVKELVFYHLVPYPENALIKSAILDEASDIHAQLTVAQDGMWWRLPANSSEIVAEKPLL